MNEEEIIWLNNHIGEVKLAPDSYFEPFEFFNSKGEYKGLSADYIHLIEKKLGFEFNYIKTPTWAKNVEMMKNRELDVWSAVVKTPQREEFMEFTQPYYEIHSVLIIPSNFKGNYVYNPDSGDIIAVIEGYYTHDYLQNTYKEEGILTFSSPLDAFKSVQNGQAAAFLTDIATASYYFEKAGITNLRVGGSPDLGPSHLSIAIRADWKILADIIDKVIVRITTEENADIIRKWIGIQSSEEVFFKIDNTTLINSLSVLFVLIILFFLFFIIRKNKKGVTVKYLKLKLAVSILLIVFVIFFNFKPFLYGSGLKFNLTEEEQIWLDNNKNLKIAPDYSFAPIEFIKDNQFNGIAADYVKILEGLLDYEFEIVKIKKWADNVESAKNREIDIWSAVAPTPQKSEYMLFTEPYLDILSVLIVSRGDEREYDLENMRGKTVAVVDGYFTHDFLQKNYPDIDLNTVENAQDGLRAVVFKHTDAMLIDIASASWLIEKNGLTTLKVVKSINIDYQLSFASRSDMPILNKIINRALNSIDQDSRDDIYHRWVSYSAHSYLDIKNIIIIFGLLAILSGIVFFVILGWNRSLRRMVSLRMEQLSEKDAQLVQAQKMEMVGTLAGGLAHDFNNILTGITGTVSLVKLHLDTDGSIPKDQLVKYLALINNSGDRAAKLVQQLLTVSRNQKPKKSVVDLKNIVQNVSSTLKNTLDNSINLSISHIDKKAVIYADAGQIEQVLLNFCFNAAHAMTMMRDSEKDWGGRLHISIKGFVPELNKTHPPEVLLGTKYWVVTVKDTGVGIPQDNLKDIFTPFYTTKVSGTGTGLGLSMVYSIAHEHNGFVEVFSLPGKGSEFRLYLPKKESEILK